MNPFFNFFAQNSTGILVFFLLMIGLAGLFQWIFWILGKGRFEQGTRGSSSALRFIFAEFFAKIIDQFRHLLALIVVLIFSVALAYAMIKSQQGTLPEGVTYADQLNEALTTIMSTLGGLIGLILGYYFGESTVTQVVKDDDAPDDPTDEDVQQLDPAPPEDDDTKQAAPSAVATADSGIRSAPPPPGADA